MLVAVSMIGVLLHVLMDLPTSYGTRRAQPVRLALVRRRLDADCRRLPADGARRRVCSASADPSPAARRNKAAFVLLLMAANYGVRAAAHHQALELAPRLFGPTLPRAVRSDDSRNAG